MQLYLYLLNTVTLLFVVLQEINSLRLPIKDYSAENLNVEMQFKEKETRPKNNKKEKKSKIRKSNNSTSLKNESQQTNSTQFQNLIINPNSNQTKDVIQPKNLMDVFSTQVKIDNLDAKPAIKIIEEASNLKVLLANEEGPIIKNTRTHVILDRLYAFENRLFPMLKNLNLISKDDPTKYIPNNQIIEVLNNFIVKLDNVQIAKLKISIDKSIFDFFKDMNKFYTNFKIDNGKLVLVPLTATK